MSTLGTPTRVSYQSPTLRTGLQDVSIIVERPDGSLLGMFDMTESPYMRGIYGYNIATTTADQPGSYQCIVMSPTEGITLIINKEIDAPLNLSAIQALLTAIVPVNISGQISDNTILTGEINLNQDTLFGSIQDSSVINGVVHDLDFLTGQIQGDTELRSSL